MFLNSSYKKLVVIILLLIPPGIVLHYIKEALTEHYRYKSLTTYENKLDLDRFHFYFKNAILKDWIKYTARTTSELTNSIPRFDLSVAEKDLEKLNSDLPRSGLEQYVPAYFKSSKTNGQVYKTEIRYRGNLPNHWLYTQKSFRVKLPKFENYLGDRKFNLINPPDLSICLDCVIYDIARELDLLVPDYYPVQLYLNNKYHGLYLYMSQVDESLLRHNHRMPGSLYNGDLFYGDLFQNGKFKYTSYGHSLGTEILLWSTHNSWDKYSSRNKEKEDDKRDIIKYIDIINEKDPFKFQQLFTQFFDTKKVFTQMAIDQYFGSYHRDMTHNHKLYFDPYKGKFETLVWDVRFWQSRNIKDVSYYPLVEKISRNPILELERDRILYQLMQKYPVNKTLSKLDYYTNLIRPFLDADTYKDYFYNLFTFGTQHAIPLMMSDFELSIIQNKEILEARYTFLNNLLNTMEIEYYWKSLNDDTHQVTFKIKGNSGSELTIKNELLKHLTIFKDVNHNHQIDELDVKLDSNVEILYSGKKKIKSPHLSSEWTEKLGGNRFYHTPVNYTFLLKGQVSKEAFLKNITFTNAVTGEQLLPREVSMTELVNKNNQIDIHPWQFLRLKKPKEIINLSGIIELKETKIFNSYQEVHIKPGTRLNMHPNASLIFYGKVLFEGTHEAPIIINRFDANKAWGAIVIQGKETRGSKFNHFKLSGGSVVSHNLIDYPGQINIHNTSDIEINYCNISRNTIGDDNLHIAYTSGLLSNCQITNSFRDAIDIDISNIELSQLNIIASGNDGLDVMNSNIKVSETTIIQSADKCISAGESSNIYINTTSLIDCHIGIASKDASLVSIDMVNIHSFNDNALSLYNKNPLYNLGGRIKIINAKGFTASDIQPDTRSKIDISHIDKIINWPDVNFYYYDKKISPNVNNKEQFINSLKEQININ